MALPLEARLRLAGSGIKYQEAGTHRRQLDAYYLLPATRRPKVGYPLTTPSGRSLATRWARSVSWQTSVTSSTFL